MRKFDSWKTDTRSSAYKKAYGDLWKNAYREYLLDNPEKLTDYCSDIEIGIMDTYIKKVRCGYRYVMVTVNPKEEVTFIDLRNKVEKCLTKVWVKEFLYCYEQRGVCAESMGTGKHVHILIEIGKYKRPADIRRECYNTFKNLVGNEKHVNCKFSMFKKNFVNYIKGQKKDLDGHKEAMCKCDVLWRINHDLKDIYYSKNFEV